MTRGWPWPACRYPLRSPDRFREGLPDDAFANLLGADTEVSRLAPRLEAGEIDAAMIAALARAFEIELTAAW